MRLWGMGPPSTPTHAMFRVEEAEFEGNGPAMTGVGESGNGVLAWRAGGSRRAVTGEADPAG